MNEHFTSILKRNTLIFLLFLFAQNTYSQSNGTSLRNDITVEHIIEFPKEGFRNEPIRLVKDEVTGNLLYNEYGGTIWEIDINSPTPSFNFRYSAFDHNLPIVQGMTMHDDVLYLVGNEEVNNGADNVGVIAKGTRIDNNRRAWTVIARTEPYLGKPETPFDHKMAGNAVSPDGQFIYVSTNSRTNHGEVAGLGREDDLNILILKIPTNPSSPINLRNDKEWLRNNGYLHAEGIRNGFDMAFDKNGNLFEVENSGQRDDPEEMNWIRPGRHYGFPYRLGGNDNPIINAGYNSNNDPLVPDDQKGTPLFAYDPNFPAPPAGVTFSEPIRNLGPDADLFRDPITGAIRDASNEGSFITTFTAHRSPVGFGFDNADIMGGNFTGDAFMASFSGNTWPLIGGDSEDLLHIELNYNGALDNYDANVYKIATGFAQPIDIVVDENIIWLAEYGDGVNRGLWKITMPCGNESVCGTITPPPPPTFSCDEIMVTGGQEKIQVSGLLAPNVAIEIYTPNNELIFSCNNSCPIIPMLSGIPAGTYQVNVKLFDDNLALVCEKNNIPAVVTSIPECNDVSIVGGEAAINIMGLTAPNEIVQVFDANYNIVFRCEGGDCGSEQLIGNLSAGTYFVGVQLYDENFGFICGRDNIEINIENATSCVCSGLIELKTQADVDAFCGCEVINGELRIGQPFTNTNNSSNINSLENLNQLKEVEGIISIINTQLAHFIGLENLQEVGSLTIAENSQLIDLTGLGNLVAVENLNIFKNPRVTNLNQLQNLTTINNQLSIDSNDNLISIASLGRVTNSTLDRIAIAHNASLISLDGLEHFTRLEKRASGSLIIDNNISLVNINGLRNLQLIEGFLTIEDHPQLTDCCTLSHLIDDNAQNGQALGNINISNNAFSCNSTEEIIENCFMSSGNCEDIIITTATNQISITGLTSPIEIVQVFDANYTPIFRCEGGDCGNEQILTDLSEGTYIIGIQFYTASWEFICEQTDIRVNVTDNGNPPPPPPTGSADCNALTFTPEASQISVAGLNTAYSQVQIIGQNTDWQVITICQGDCAATQIIPNLATGEYTVKVQLNASDGTDCYREEKVIVGGTPPPPPPPTNGNCEDLNIFAANSELFIQGLSAPIEIVQIFDQNYQVVFRCQGADCGSEQIINDLAAGNYFVSVQFYTANWKFICAEENIVVAIEDGGGGNTGGGCDEAEKNGFNELGTIAGKAFYSSQSSLSIDRAKQACIAANSRLATNLSSETIDFIKANIDSEVFIDLSDANQEGNFQWADGSNYGVEIFDNKPENDLVFIATWNDQLIATNNSVWKQFICEVSCTNSNSSRNAPITQLEQSIKLFPNPAQSIINLQVLPLLDKKGTIQIFNVYGQLVQQFNQLHFKEAHQQLEIPNFENGLYWLTIQAENMPLISKRFIVEHWK